jgi:uroporphyrinogen-III decarboxylase
MADTGIDGIDTNIDPVNTLLRKSREEVRADALRRMAIGSPRGGYILSSACSVSPRVPPENLTVLVEASMAFGTPPA